jgi:hypothetical protein
MNKNITTSIQPSSDYLCKPLSWKDELASSVKSDFVVPNFNNLYESSLEITSDKLETYAGLDYTRDIGLKDFKINGHAQINYPQSDYVNLIYEEIPQWHIIDAGVSCKSLTGSYGSDDFYTTPQVANEAGGNLSHFLSQDNICLKSFTPHDFKECDNFISATGPFDNTGNVSFQKESNNTIYLACGHVAAGTLTNTTTGENITICGDILYSKSTNDFGLAVNGIAFCTTTSIFTEDKCLGYAFAKFGSFRPSRSTFWKTEIRIKSGHKGG